MSSMPSNRSYPQPDPRSGAARLALSIVVPAFNEEQCLPELIARTDAMLDRLDRSAEIIVINDGSSDGTLATLRSLTARYPRLVVVDLDRNFGQHNAVLAGFSVARGEAVITLDADLQNPPEEIPKLVAKLDEGFDVVGTIRQERQDNLRRKIASRFANRFVAKSIGLRLTDYGCMLRGYQRNVVRQINEFNEASTFVPVVAESVARSVTEVMVDHAPRTQGESKYNLTRLLKLELDLLTTFSVWPLRLMMVAGIFMSMIAALCAVVLIAGRFVFGAGWAVNGVFTVFAVVFVFLGVQLFAIGLLGEYIGRIHVQVRQRPRFVIRSVMRDGETLSE